MLKKYTEYILSVSRIILALGLLFINLNSLLFIIVYLLCGLTDIADGYIARKYRFESNLGAKIDSLADFILVMVILIVFVLILSPYLLDLLSGFVLLL